MWKDLKKINVEKQCGMASTFSGGLLDDLMELLAKPNLSRLNYGIWFYKIVPALSALLFGKNCWLSK